MIRTTLLSLILCFSLFSFAQKPDVCDSLTGEFTYTMADTSGLVAFKPVMNTDWSLYSGVGAMVAFYDVGGTSGEFDTFYHRFDAPGKYKVCYYVTNESSAQPICDSLWCDSVEVVFGKVLNIPQTNRLNTNIYPNPSSDFVVIELEDVGSYEVELFDILGQSVLDRKVYQTEKVEIDLGEMQSGIYNLRITQGSAVGLHRIIKSEVPH